MSDESSTNFLDGITNIKLLWVGIQTRLVTWGLMIGD